MSNSVIIADLNSSSGEFAKKVYQNLDRRENRRFNLSNLSICRFRDEEIKPKIADNIRRKRCYFIHDSAKRPAEWYLELNLVNETLKNSDAGEIIDVIPYMRFCRQDRKDESRVSISIATVVKNISNYAKKAICLDAHFPQIQALFSIAGIPFENLYSAPTVAEYIKKKCPEIIENCVFMSPDAGGMHRVEAFAKRFGVEDFAVGLKTRPKAGEIGGRYQSIGDVEGKNVLLIDDIIDSGETLIRAAKEVKERGAIKVYAYGTHGLFTKGTNLSGLERIFTTDTIYRGKAENVEIIPTYDLFAEAIYRIDKGESISALFD